jgi:hypothetical protein
MGRSGSREKKSIKERLIDKIAISDDCWVWIGDRFHNGYGRLNIDGKLKSAHRLSYEEFVGPIPNGLCVCHRCDNPPCIKPSHLFVGTNFDNMQDMRRKGRGSGNFKLTSEQILYIRAKYDAAINRPNGITGHQLAMIKRRLEKKFGIHETHLRAICLRLIWRHI